MRGGCDPVAEDGAEEREVLHHDEDGFVLVGVGVAHFLLEEGERFAEVEEGFGAGGPVPLRVEDVAHGVACAQYGVEECRIFEEPIEGGAFEAVEVYGTVEWGQRLIRYVVGESPEEDGL